MDNPVYLDNEICTWIEEKEGEYYSASCGMEFFLDSGNPDDNNMIFCPMCGKHLVFIANKEESYV